MTRYKNKKLEILTESDLIYGNNSWLKNRFCVEPSDKENGEMTDLWYDCDYIKVEGESGRGDEQFITCQNQSTYYVITRYEVDREALDVLMWWLDGCKNEVEIENTWSAWDNVYQGVAYRGGSGYCYGLYAKELGNLL